MIRLATAADAEGILAIYAPIVRTSPITFEIEPPTPGQMAGRVGDTLAKYPWLVFDEGGEVAGYAYATTHRVRAAYQWSVETSVYIAEHHRRRGLGRILYESLFGVLAAQGFVNAYAGITLPNPASVALHEAVGFTPLGVYRQIGFKAGGWHDVGWWERRIVPQTATPAAPTPLPELMATPRWQQLGLSTPAPNR